MRRTLSPDTRIVGQGLRFAVAGCVVAVVYLLTTTLLFTTGMPFQAALAIGFCVGLAVHFSLQRRFVWADHEEFALPLHHQAGRYLALAGAQYGVTAASTSLLPAVLGLPVEVVYLPTVALLTSINFLVFRRGIFHAR
jgi:putative flippase GtrA